MFTEVLVSPGTYHVSQFECGPIIKSVWQRYPLVQYAARSSELHDVSCKVNATHCRQLQMLNLCSLWWWGLSHAASCCQCHQCVSVHMIGCLPLGFCAKPASWRCSSAMLRCSPSSWFPQRDQDKRLWIDMTATEMGSSSSRADRERERDRDRDRERHP